MVDVKHGGVRKDLKPYCLLRVNQLPIENMRRCQCLFTYDKSEGPYWNYAQRYHNIYTRESATTEVEIISKTSDFWDDA